VSTITFSTLRGPRIFEKIVEHIRDAILAGRLRPGDRLPPERELVRQFQVGRGAIREAYRILEQSGLIRIRAGNGGGAFVGGQPAEAVTRSLSDLLRFGNFELRHITQVRLALENLIVDTVVQNAGRPELARLAASVERAQRLHEENKTEQRVEEHFNFHVLLAEATGNPVYPLLIRAVVDIMQPVWKKTGSPETLARHTVAFHRKIVNHLMAGDATRAKRELKRHIVEAEKLITASSAKRAPARVARLTRTSSR